jgi:hypothetical protein
MAVLDSHSIGFSKKASLGDANGSRPRPRPGASRIPGRPRPFTVKGRIEPEDSDEMRQVHVFVIVEQPKARGKAVATGYHLEEGEAKLLKTWSAEMTVQKGPKFEADPDRPAIGTALIVEFKNDPIGFETYSWTAQITLTE